MTATLETGSAGPNPEQTPDPTATGAAAPTKVAHHDLPVLEAYRGIAALLVLVGHVGYTSGAGIFTAWAGWLSRSDFGVTLFFLLSGFLLFRPFVQAAYGRRPAPEVGSYLRRRFVRIYPAYLVLVVGIFLLSAHAREQPGKLWVQSIFLVQNYTTSFTKQLEGMVQIWSLVVEVSFYLTLPLLAVFVLGRGTGLAERTGVTVAEPEPEPAPAQPLSRRAAREAAQRPVRRRPRPVAATGPFSLPAAWQPHRPLIALGALTVLALSWRYYYTVTDFGVNKQALWLPAFLDWFAAGMALAWLRERPQPLPVWLRNLASSPGVCFCLALAGYWLITQEGLGGPYNLDQPTTGQVMFKHIVYEIVAILVLLPAVFGPATAGWRRHAVNPVMAWLGRISFGVFLWHPILIETVRRPLGYEGPFTGGFWITLIPTLALSFLMGTLSWRFVEEPLQRRFRNGLRQGVARQPQRPAAGRPAAVPRVRVRWSKDPAAQPARPALEAPAGPAALNGGHPAD